MYYNMKFEYILMIGAGGVGRAVLELFKLEKVTVDKLIIIEPRDLPKWLKCDQHIQLALTPENLKSTLIPLINSKTTVIDVSVYVDALPIMEICKKKNAKYINTSLESWSEEKNDDGKLKINKDTVLFHRLNSAKKLLQGANSTIISDAGANPGLITSFVKMGLKEVAKKYKDEDSLKLISEGKFNLAAERMCLEVVHVSEIDTQETNIKMKEDTFYNSWSALGFTAECCEDPVVIGYGSVENNKSKQWIKPTDSKNPIVRIMKKRGCDVIKRSYCLDHSGKVHKIEGYVVQHAENYTIAKLLKNNDYRVSVYYVYCCSNPAKNSVNKVIANDYKPLPNWHVFSLEEIKNNNSFDSVGACLYFSGKGSIEKIGHWYGSSLSTAEVKKLGFKHSNATVVQVAISILSTLEWIDKNNEHEGYITPEDLNYEYILENSKKYLGKLLSKSFTYTEKSPLSFDKF
jgi:homospermidine synthase